MQVTYPFRRIDVPSVPDWIALTKYLATADSCRKQKTTMTSTMMNTLLLFFATVVSTSWASQSNSLCFYYTESFGCSAWSAHLYLDCGHDDPNYFCRGDKCTVTGTIDGAEVPSSFYIHSTVQLNQNTYDLYSGQVSDFSEYVDFKFEVPQYSWSYNGTKHEWLELVQKGRWFL